MNEIKLFAVSGSDISNSREAYLPYGSLLKLTGMKTSVAKKLEIVYNKGTASIRAA